MKSNYYNQGGIIIKKVVVSLIVFFLGFGNIAPCFCIAKENSNNTGQTSKSKTSTTEKNTNKNKTENQKKDDKSQKNKTESSENTNKPESDNKNEESQKEISEENTTKSKSSVPKMNSILSEKSTTDNQKSDSNNEETSKEISENEFNLPQVDDSEVAETSNIPTPESTSEPRDMQKTIFAWIMICVGVAVILATIIINLKMPRGNIHNRYHEKHGIKSGKNKYRLKYK